MITYSNLSKHPQVAPRLIGMSLPTFDQLYAEFEVAHQQRLNQAKLTRRTNTRRQRAAGAGRKHQYDLRDRLLMTLFWLQVYMTYEVLGFFYQLNKTNIEDNLKDVQATLATMTSFTVEHSSPDRLKLHSPEAVMTAFPEVELVIEAKEQPVRRPKPQKDDRVHLYYGCASPLHSSLSQDGG